MILFFLIQFLQGLNTYCNRSVQNLDSIENYLQQVDKSEEDQFSGSQRRGRIYIQRFRQTIEPNSESSNERAATLNLIQILETAAILDLKWSPGADWNNYLIDNFVAEMLI